MTIIKTEVKTFTNIALNFKDFVEIINAFKDNENNTIFHPKAFDFADLNDMTVGNIRNIMQKFQFKSNKDTLDFIARHFGFDGWHNAGRYDEQKGKYLMVVYSYGDTLNG